MSSPTTSKGEYLAGLETRRKAEWCLFQTGWTFDQNGETYFIGNSGASGDFLSVAKTCWLQVCNKFTTYGGTRIPPTGTTIDCSAYVSWVLYEYGYSDFKGGQNTAYTFYTTNWKSKYGWEEISVGSGQNPYNKLQSGDIFVRYGSGTHHVMIVVEKKDGKIYSYDCGSKNNWINNSSGDPIDRSYFLTYKGSGKIIRVTSPK